MLVCWANFVFVSAAHRHSDKDTVLMTISVESVGIAKAAGPRLPTADPSPNAGGGDGRAGAREGGALARGLRGGARASVVFPFPRWALPRLPR